MGDRLPEVVEPGVTGLVLEPDDGDRPPGSCFLRDELPDKERDERQEDGRRRDPNLPGRKPDGDLLGGQRLPDRQRMGGRRQRLFNPGEVDKDLLRAPVALLPRFFKAFEDDTVQVLRDLGVERPGGGRRLALLLDGDAQRRIALERKAAGQHLEEDDPQGIEVRAGAGLLALDLLGRHILGRPDHHVAAGDAFGADQAGDPEIHDPGVAISVDHDVRGLEIAVDDPQPVGLGEPLGNLAGHPEGGAHSHLPRAPDEGLQVIAPDVFHGDEERALFLV